MEIIVLVVLNTIEGHYKENKSSWNTNEPHGIIPFLIKDKYIQFVKNVF